MCLITCLVDGDYVWKVANTVFDNLPVAALVENAVCSSPPLYRAMGGGKPTVCT